MADLEEDEFENKFLSQAGVNTWDYAIGEDKLALTSNQEVVLAVYRQGEASVRSGYDYQDEASIDEMIQDDLTVLLLKIRVRLLNQ